MIHSTKENLEAVSFFFLLEQVPSESEKVVVEQLFQRDAVIRQSQVTLMDTLAASQPECSC